MGKPEKLHMLLFYFFRQYRIILSADTASEVRQMQAKSADNTGCIIEHFGNADAVPQLPERCLSRKAGIVRCCLYYNGCSTAGQCLAFQHRLHQGIAVIG